VGSRFRCACGNVVEVSEPQSHDASVIHCAACGASREEGARACTYCGGDFTLHELDLKTVCPGCLARVSDRARYCHHCATPLAAQAIAGEEQPLNCPVCEDRQLVSRHLESISTTVLECQRLPMPLAPKRITSGRIVPEVAIRPAGHPARRGRSSG